MGTSHTSRNQGKILKFHGIRGYTFSRLQGSLLLSYGFPAWYVGWNKQWAALRARARLNGATAKCAQECGAYVVPHPGIQAAQDEGLYDIHCLGSLSIVGNLLFMSDVVNKVKTIKCPFKVAWLNQQLPHKMFTIVTNKLLESRIVVLNICK